jgi:hypothetical protein
MGRGDRGRPHRRVSVERHIGWHHAIGTGMTSCQA